MVLLDGSYTWQFVPVDGHTFTDSGSGRCVAHGGLRHKQAERAGD